MTPRPHVLGILMLVPILMVSCAQMSALHIAAIKGDIGRIERLITKGTDVNAKDKKNNTPLHYAAENGHTAVTKQLIVQGADVNVKGVHGNTPLHYALYRGHKAVADLLIAHGADANMTNNYGETPLDFETLATIEKLIISEASLLDNNANWTDRREGRKIYNDLKKMKGELVTKALV